MRNSTQTVLDSLLQQGYTTDVAEYLCLFEYSHLPISSQETSKLFYDLAYRIANYLPRNRQRTEALKKLLEVKDCAVRATLLGA